MMEGVKILNDDAKVKVIFVNIFGGMVDCYKVLTSIKITKKREEINKPIIIRMKGFGSKNSETV
jgi:succinyl-CoA synthetase beta subunit